MKTREFAPVLGVDFGDGAIVCGSLLPDGGGFLTHAFSGWSQEIGGTGTSGTIHRIPTLIRYRYGNDRDIGDEVVREGFSDYPSTARWIRSYLLEESGALVTVDDARRVTFREAAFELLCAILEKIITEHLNIRTVVFSVPEDAPSWYRDWLTKVSLAAGMTSSHTLGECTAAAAGYGLVVGKEQSFFHFSCDETALSLRIVRNNESPDSVEMEVIGSAKADTGSHALDSWIAQEIVAKSHLPCHGKRGQIQYNAALACVPRVLQNLTRGNEALAEFLDPAYGRPVSVKITSEDLVRLMADHGIPAILDDVIRRARGLALARGYTDNPPVAILLTGRGFLLQEIQALVRERFIGVPVHADHPLDAIARGACLFSFRIPGSDRIRNNYALRYWDPASREHRYRFLVHSGTRFPSAGQVARITISAAYDGQARLGLSLYEIGGDGGEAGPSLELVQDPAGGMRLAGPEKDTGEGSGPRLVNGTMPTLLNADPPGIKGEPRFELTFTIDRERHLCLTARDILSGMLVRRQTMVYRLT